MVLWAVVFAEDTKIHVPASCAPAGLAWSRSTRSMKIRVRSNKPEFTLLRLPRKWHRSLLFQVKESKDGIWSAWKYPFCKQPVREPKLRPVWLTLKLDSTVPIGCVRQRASEPTERVFRTNATRRFTRTSSRLVVCVPSDKQGVAPFSNR
jgi:hypothetical protein